MSCRWTNSHFPFFIVSTSVKQTHPSYKVEFQSSTFFGPPFRDDKDTHTHNIWVYFSLGTICPSVYKKQNYYNKTLITETWIFLFNLAIQLINDFAWDVYGWSLIYIFMYSSPSCSSVSVAQLITCNTDTINQSFDFFIFFLKARFLYTEYPIFFTVT